MRPTVPRYLLLCAQLAVLSVIASWRMWDLLGQSLAIASVAFAVHIWLPVAWKEPVWIVTSLVAIAWGVGVPTLAYVVALAVLLFGILRLPLAYRARCVLVLAVFAVLIVLARFDLRPPMGTLRLFGAIFGMKMFLYLYVNQDRPQPSFTVYCAYFFNVPTMVGHAIAPIVDYEKMRAGFLKRPQAHLAQQGIRWIATGMAQVLIHQQGFTYGYLPLERHWPPTTFVAVCKVHLAALLIYLVISGSFHIYVGIMHLFGYEMPRSNDNYLLASSPLELWRRVNIYTRIYLEKLVFLPTYFRLRRWSDFGGQIIALSLTLLCTFASHVWSFGFWQSEWSGSLVEHIRGPEFFAYAGLGGLCVLQLVVRRLRPPGRTVRGRAVVPLPLRGLQIAVMASLFVTSQVQAHMDDMSMWGQLLWWRNP